MTRDRGKLAAGLAIAILLDACTAPPPGPSFAAAPAPGQPFEAFAADDMACRQFAAAQTAPGVAIANEWSAAGVLLGAALGAGIGAGVAGGHGAAVGAAAGAGAGTAVGAVNAASAQGPLQQQYDLAYAQCMQGRGDRTPGFPPPPAAPRSGEAGSQM